MCRPFFQRNRQVSLPGLSKGRYTTPGASRTRIAGMISGMGKIDWGNIPPRITARNAINPPQHMAQQLGFPDDVIFSTVYYNGQPVMPFTLLLHFSFAIVFSILFILLIQKWKQVGMAQGAVYGLIIWGCLACHPDAPVRHGSRSVGPAPSRSTSARFSATSCGLVDCRSCVLPDQASEGQHAHLPRVIRFQVSRPEQKGPAHRN